MHLAERVHKPIIILLVLLSALLYYNVGYNTIRTNFFELAIQITILFLFLGCIWYLFKKSDSDINLKIIQFSGILFRLILLFSIPNLSDDFYRFLWDGNMINLNFNPYLILPETYTQTSELNLYMRELYENMNSRTYFTVYPPLNQFIFTVSTNLFPQDIFKQIVLMKSFLFVAELLVIYKLPGLLQKMGISKYISALYILNPLVIIETLGNLHFEGLGVCMLLLTISMIKSDKWIAAAIFYALSVGIKLLPLIFLPLLIRFYGFKRGLFFVFSAFLVNLILFLPFMDIEAFVRMFGSIELYFNKFEFNASIYYVIRSVGYYIRQYNIIQTAGMVLSIITFLLIVILSLKMKRNNYKDLMKYMLFSMLVYYSLSTTVHPWYIVTPLFVAVLCNCHRSVFLWTWIIFSSYHTYMTQPYSENILITALSYLIVFSALIFEIKRNEVSIAV